jgi:hypothetical protein
MEINIFVSYPPADGRADSISITITDPPDLGHGVVAATTLAQALAVRPAPAADDDTADHYTLGFLPTNPGNPTN